MKVGTRKNAWRTVLAMSATILTVSTATTAQAKSTQAKRLTGQQMQNLGLKNDQDVEDYMTIKRVQVVEVIDDDSGRQNADILMPPVTLPPTIPNAQQPSGTINPNQAPAGAGDNGTWPPSGGTGPINVPQIPTGSDGGGWNGKLTSITGLDINGWIAIGTVVAQLVVANQPVVTTSAPSLSVLPAASSNWSQMTGWSLPVVKTYRITVVNVLGVKTVDLTYKLMWSCNGSFSGTGHYIANLHTAVDKLDVAWGYNVDFKTVANDAINRGTVADPIPAVGLDLNLHIHTYLKDGQRTDSYFIAGDGNAIPVK